ncbi:2-hydroxy-palmitic acid dioxygenase MPO1-like [Andrographis paniculata]|uniref:2-hydroxy-palmitic acid dioxygenase MPO1-like n=1 Tax=Andrographis paniculata TaxID=175694 RepID=UPI0021E97010|nr:2-hydroxy-palmitic acid dioxygenase MPO1-like [Andrographis paniculata]
MELFDLEKQFAFFHGYHRNLKNIFVHVVFVWPIFFMFLLMLYFTPPLITHSPINDYLVFNYGFFLALGYSIYYLCLDKTTGSLAAFFCLICWIGSSALAHRLGFSLAAKVAVGSQLLSLVAQLTSHAIFEKRVPSVIDNLFQTLVLAQFFVLLEVLQLAFDYEPYPEFNAKVKAIVDNDIKLWEDEKSKKRS